MSNLLDSNDFGTKIYNRFPAKYREDDAGEKYALKRYIQALSDGGFKYVIDEINGLTDLINPNEATPPVLYILFEQYGLEVFNGIPEEFLRYLLPRLGEAWSKKGSLSAIEFISSSITGIKSSTEVSYDENDDPQVEVRLEMDFNLSSYFPEPEQLKRLLMNFTPFYCDLNILYSYLFYVTGNLQALDRLILTHIEDVKNEKGLIVYGKGDRYFPMLTGDISNMTLNKGFITNHSVYYDLDADYTINKVSYKSSEKCGLTRKTSSNYYRNALNSEVKELNDNLVLNENIDTDELVSTKIVIPSADTPSVETKEYLLNKTTEGSFYFLSALNTDKCLNVDLMTSEGNTDLTYMKGAEESSFKFSDNKKETGSIEQNISQSVDMFLNLNDCVLNDMCLSSLQGYDKVTIKGVTSIIYPTQFGCITA